MKYCKRLICASFLLFLTVSLCAHQIRVGYFLYSGFQNLENGEYSGYGYEYLREIQKFNDWQYQFITETDELDENGKATGRKIPLSYDRALTLLKEGKLDIVGSVRKSPEREQLFLFPRFGSGIAYEMLTTDSQKKEIDATKRIIIGLRTGSIRETEFRKIYKEAGFDNVTFRYFDYNDEMEKALHTTREIDFILSSSLRKTSQEQLVYKYNPANHYYIFNKDRFDLLEEFNTAQSELLLQKTEFTQELYTKYYEGTKNSTLWISETEKKYIAEHPVISVIHDSSWFPIDYTDAEGNAKGIVHDVFYVLERETGLRFNFISGSNYKNTLGLFNGTKDAILAIFANDYAWAEMKQLTMSSSYINLPMSAVTYKRVDNIWDPALTVAAVDGYFFTYKFLSGHKNVLLLENVEACMEAVQNKKADITFIATYSAERLLQRPKYEKLNFYTLADMNYDICIGFHLDVDPVLYKILHKAVNNLSQADIDQCIYDNTLYYREPENFRYFTEKYGHGIILGIVGLIGIIIFTSYLFYLNSKGKKRNEKLALANSELQKAFSFAEQANRAKTEFLSRISHDIRTPMNIIMGMTDIALENVQDSEHVKKSLEKILNASDFLLKLINDVLDMSRIENGKMIIAREYFYLSEIVTHLKDFFDHKMKEKNLSFSVDCSLVVHEYVRGDAVHIEQILMNLLSNALKYTQNGSVSVTIEESQRETVFSLFTFKVTDTGIGIKNEFLPKIWEPFEKEKIENSSSVSFGLGLAIVKSLVHLMGGTVGVTSNEGKGSSFTITLPLEVNHNDTQSGQIQPPLEVKHYEFHNEIILLVEDNEMNMEIAKLMLQKKNLRTDEAYSGEEAVTMFSESRPGFYSAILMDIRMPGIDGREATKRIRSLNRKDAQSIPIIAMSADAFTEEIQISQSAGMNDYITKPIRKQEVYKILDKWLNQKEL